MTSMIEKTVGEDILSDVVSLISNSQASVDDGLQKEESSRVYAETSEVHESTYHSILEEDKSSDSKTSGSSLQQSESPILKEEPNNNAASASNLKHDVIENALESKERQGEEVPKKKETSDAIL